MRSRLVLSALVAAALFAASPASAVPTMTTLTAVVTGSPSIVIAKVHGASAAGYELDVERALRGKAHGPLLVKIPPSASVPFAVGTRVVAFLGPGDTWHTSGQLAAGPTLEDGALHLEGLPACCDASVVLPGVLTLAMLEDAIKGTPLTWTFRGKLVLPGSGGPTPSTIDIVATTNGASTPGAGTVSGVPRMVGFPAPTVLVGGFAHDVTLTWNTTASRPLRLVGQAIGKNRDGSIAVEYRLDEPRALTEPDLRRYLGDATLAYPYYVTELKLASGATMTLTLGKEVGRVGELTTSKGSFPVSGLSTAPTRYVTTSAGNITLDPRPATFTPQRTGAQGELIQELLLGPVGCRWETGTTPAVPCTLSLVATRFATK